MKKIHWVVAGVFVFGLGVHSAFAGPDWLGGNFLGTKGPSKTSKPGPVTTVPTNGQSPSSELPTSSVPFYHPGRSELPYPEGLFKNIHFTLKIRRAGARLDDEYGWVNGRIDDEERATRNSLPGNQITATGIMQDSTYDLHLKIDDVPNCSAVEGTLKIQLRAEHDQSRRWPPVTVPLHLKGAFGGSCELDAPSWDLLDALRNWNDQAMIYLSFNATDHIHQWDDRAIIQMYLAPQAVDGGFNISIHSNDGEYPWVNIE